MKTMKTMMAGILITSTLFTACRKDNNMMVDPANPTSASAKAVGQTFPIDFYGGHVVTSSASVMVGERSLYRSTTLNRIELFAPVVSTYGIEPGDYKDLTVRMGARPFRDNAAVTLIGKMIMADGTGTEVNFVINEPVSLKAYNQPYSISDRSDFIRLLNIKPELLTRDIPPAMMADLERREGKVIISSESNTEVYRMMLDNLGTMTGISFNPPVPDPQPAPTVAPDPGPMM